MKTVTFDIETSDLAGVGAGFILCVTLKPLGRPVKTFHLGQYKDWQPGREGGMVKAVLEELALYDLWVGHNIIGFDVGFLKTRAQVLGVPFTVCPFVYDTMKAFGRSRLRSRLNGFGKPSKGLGMVADLLGLKQEKTSVHPREWWTAVWAREEDERAAALSQIVRHCEADVRMTEKVYLALMPTDYGATISRWR